MTKHYKNAKTKNNNMDKPKQQDPPTNRLHTNKPTLPKQRKTSTNNRWMASKHATRQTTQSNLYANMPKTSKKLQKNTKARNRYKNNI